MAGKVTVCRIGSDHTVDVNVEGSKTVGTILKAPGTARAIDARSAVDMSVDEYTSTRKDQISKIFVNRRVATPRSLVKDGDIIFLVCKAEAGSL